MARADSARLVAFLQLAVTGAFLLLIQGMWVPTAHWLSWGSLLGLAVVTHVNFRLGNSPWVVVTLVLGVLLVCLFLLDAPRFEQRLWVDEVVLALPKIAVLTFAGGLRRPLAGFLGTMGVYLGMTAGSMIVNLQIGQANRFDLFATVALLVMLIIGFSGVVVQRFILPARARIRAAEDEEALTRLHESAESLAVARIHDTFLNQLSAIAIERGTQLSPSLLAGLRDELAEFESPQWMSGVVEVPSEHDYQRWMGSGVFHAISEARSRGLEVALSGDILLVAKLGPEQDRALGLAVRQCLLNVLRHAETLQAEVTISAIDEHLTVVVADEGVGFDPDAVAGDRIGLRHSVFRRVELADGSVRLFSTPGVGTSVVLLVPYERPAPAAAVPSSADARSDRLVRSGHEAQRWFSRILGRRGAPSLQQLDPLGTVVYWPIALFAAGLIAALPFGITMWRFSTGLAVGGPEQRLEIIGGVALASLAAVLLGVMTMPKHTPMTPMRMLLLNLILLAATAIAYWHYFDTRLVAGMSWGSLIVALFFLGVAAYRPPKRLLVNTLGVSVSVFVYAFLLAQHHLQMGNPLLLAMLAGYPILVVGLGAWRFSDTAIKQARQWQRINLERELRLANQRMAAAQRGVQLHWRERLGAEVVPFLRTVVAQIESGLAVSSQQRQRATRLAEALRTVLVAESRHRWYRGELDPEVLRHLDELNEIVAGSDGAGDAGGMRPGQRSALRAYLRFLLEHPRGHPQTLRIRVSQERDAKGHRVELRLRMMLDVSYAEFAVRASVVFFLLRLEFPDVVANFTRPILDVKFSYDKE